MKMFESVDSTATRSGRDLWAEICSCLPNPDEDVANNAFSDSFVNSYPTGEGQREAENFAVQPAIKPWAPLQDSEVYLASLEKKLRRIKGLNEEVTSKDMLRTLAQAKKECWDRFLQEKLASEFFVDGLDSDESFRRTQHLCLYVVLKIEPGPHACQANALPLEPHPQPQH
ncbi:coiled-coil domain-containing protein 32 isoform X2 [Marmota flaviventris]|uniref:coiled-coil domain-containing protein 32 isoform X2 n=1 Tax=Marmota flaviventris TaxID=93162 RepID=UPI003A8C3EF5